MTAAPPIDVVPFWARMNEQLISLVDAIPDDKLNWSPQPQLWNFRGVLIHIAGARDTWMGGIVQDGDTSPSTYETARSKDDIKRAYRRTWERMERFLCDPAKVAATYRGVHPDNEPYSLTGHWIAYHLLEHDIHHRSDVFHYLALLGIEHPQVGTP
jgi:uncharacterized damage-inducible protein DinB